MATLRWRRICCAVDGSEPSRAALEHAAERARLDGAELQLVHVREAAGVALPPFAPPPSPRTQRQESSWDASRWIGLAERAGAPAPVRAFERVGDPAAEIVAHATEHGCDVIVVGARARRGFTRMFFGSVAETVMHDAACPVLVVPEHASGARGRPDLHVS